jgi:hypothetical protein
MGTILSHVGTHPGPQTCLGTFPERAVFQRKAGILLQPWHPIQDLDDFFSNTHVRSADHPLETKSIPVSPLTWAVFQFLVCSCARDDTAGASSNTFHFTQTAKFHSDLCPCFHVVLGHIQTC